MMVVVVVVMVVMVVVAAWTRVRMTMKSKAISMQVEPSTSMMVSRRFKEEHGLDMFRIV